jgi:hypothetical protein
VSVRIVNRRFMIPISCSVILLGEALLYQPTYSARKAITEEFTYHGR